MAIKQTKAVADIPSSELEDWGHALFHPDNGETIDIRAGDTVYFDENSKGTWEVVQTVRKAYLTFKRE